MDYEQPALDDIVDATWQWLDAGTYISLAGDDADDPGLFTVGFDSEGYVGTWRRVPKNYWSLSLRALLNVGFVDDASRVRRPPVSACTNTDAGGEGDRLMKFFFGARRSS